MKGGVPGSGVGCRGGCLCAVVVSWSMASLCNGDNGLMVIIGVVCEWVISLSYLLNELDMKQGRN